MLTVFKGNSHIPWKLTKYGQVFHVCLRGFGLLLGGADGIYPPIPFHYPENTLSSHFFREKMK